MYCVALNLINVAACPSINRMHFRGEPKVVDLTTERRVATKLMESLVSCTEDERDEVLYYLLARCEKYGVRVWHSVWGAWSGVAGVMHGRGEGRLPAGQV